MNPAFVDWCDEYKTGNAHLDRQHQQLFEIINKLYELIERDYRTDFLKDTLDQLIKYSVEYFNTQEFLMSSYQYLGYDEHKRIHNQLKVKLKELRENVETKQSSINAEILDFLNQILLTHLKEEDLKIIKFFQEKEDSSTAELTKLRRTKLAINSYYTRNMLNRQKKS